MTGLKTPRRLGRDGAKSAARRYPGRGGIAVMVRCVALCPA